MILIIIIIIIMSEKRPITAYSRRKNYYITWHSHCHAGQKQARGKGECDKIKESLQVHLSISTQAALSPPKAAVMVSVHARILAHVILIPELLHSDSQNQVPPPNLY